MTVGFIGTGNMGGALATAAAKAIAPKDIVLHDHLAEKAAALAGQLGCASGSLADAAGCDYIFLGVKPQFLSGLFADLAPVLAQKQSPFVLVSMAAGVCIADLRKMAGQDYPVIRIMPNTPASVGEGMILYAATENVSDQALEGFRNIMGCAGVLDPLPEQLIDAGSAVSGCGPAFACLFLEALSDGGVKCGLPRNKALLYAAQMLLGTARLAMASGQHPGALKDAVCSPGGSTIVGVQALEEHAFRGAVIDAVEAAFERTKALGK